MARLTTKEISNAICEGLARPEYAGMVFDIPDGLDPFSEVEVTLRYRPAESESPRMSLFVRVDVGGLRTRILTIPEHRVDEDI